MNQKGMKNICYNSIVHVKSGLYPSENANWAAPHILSAEMYCLMAACIATNGQSPSGSHCFCHHITPLQNVGVCGGAGAVPSIHSPAAFMQESVLALCAAWWWCPMIAMFANALEKQEEKWFFQSFAVSFRRNSNMTWPSSKSTFDFRPFIPCSKLPRHTPLKYGIVWKYTTPAFTGLSSFSPFESPTSFWDTPTNHHASIRLLVNIQCIYICICLYELFPSQSHIVLGSPTLTTPNNARSANLRKGPDGAGRPKEPMGWSAQVDTSRGFNSRLQNHLVYDFYRRHRIRYFQYIGKPTSWADWGFHIFQLPTTPIIWAISKTLGSRKGHPQIWEGPIAYYVFLTI